MGLLSAGVASRVYLANQERFNRPVAVKVLAPGSVACGAVELLRDEARFLAVLSAHPNILTLFDAGVSPDGCTYLVTEFLPAGSYGQLVRSDGPLEWAEVARIGVQLAGALETSHLYGVVHGDVKPDNVLIGRVGQPLLGDFGVAVLLSRSQVTENALLTPLHSAPEIFGGAPGSVPADIYGLGSTLQSLLTGSSPAGSPGDPPSAIVARVERGERVAVDAPSAPAVLVDLLGVLTATDPTERPSSAAQVGAALQEIQRSNGASPTEMYVMSEQPVAKGEGDAPEPIGGAPAEVTAPPPGAVRLQESGDPAGIDSGSQGGFDPQRDSSRDSAPDSAPDPPSNLPSDSAQSEGRSGNPARLKAALAVVAGLLAVGAITVFAWTQSRTDASGLNEAEKAAGVDRIDDPTTSGSGTAEDQRGDSGEPVTSVSVPESGIGGIQPGVILGNSDLEDTSAELESTLSEEAVIFGRLPVLPVPRPYYGAILTTLPATFHYQAFNSELPETCSGMMSRPITVVGLWERTSMWPGGIMLVAVAEAENAETAHELATVLSLDVGVQPADCHGIGEFNVSDYSDYGVEHRDVEELLPEGDLYNVWSETDLTVGSQTWAYSTRMLTEVEQYVVDVSLVSGEQLAMGNDDVVGTIAEQIRGRLVPSD